MESIITELVKAWAPEDIMLKELMAKLDKRNMFCSGCGIELTIWEKVERYNEEHPPGAKYCDSCIGEAAQILTSRSTQATLNLRFYTTDGGNDWNASRRID